MPRRNNLAYCDVADSFDFIGQRNSKARISGEPRGLVKIIADSASDEILGVHMLGLDATELIHEAVAFMEMRGTARDLAEAVHGHSCLHETVWRASPGWYTM